MGPAGCPELGARPHVTHCGFCMRNQNIETKSAEKPRALIEPAKKQPITLSILLPVRNEGINLRIMVKLLKAVVEVPHELLIVYDFPEDDSIQVIRDMENNWANLRLVHNQRGRGVVNAIQSGVEAAVGDYVLLFAADEIGPLLAIEDMLALMQRRMRSRELFAVRARRPAPGRIHHWRSVVTLRQPAFSPPVGMCAERCYHRHQAVSALPVHDLASGSQAGGLGGHV